MKKPKNDELQQQLAELTQDLQRVRADFENYRKRVDSEKEMARASGKMSAIMQLLPVIDNIDRALVHLPSELSDHPWVQGIAGLVKNLDTSLVSLHLTRIDAAPGVTFNPEVHEAVQFDDIAEGEHEVIAEQLQPGYMLGTDVLRPAMVKVTKN